MALNYKEDAIVRAIHRRGGRSTINRISTDTGMSWLAVKKHLTQLVKEEMVIEK